jgi:hypothetical protein
MTSTVRTGKIYLARFTVRAPGGEDEMLAL